MLQHIDANTTVITPNRRLSATLHKRYQQHRLDQQHTCWPTPDILPVSSWIDRLWRDHTSRQFAPSPLILNPAQEQFLWEKIVLLAKESEQLLQIAEAAEIAKSAWGLLQQWQVDIHQPLFRAAQDYAALYQWALEFQKIIAENNWLDAASLPNLVIEKINTTDILPPKRIILAGFTEISPQLKKLLSACEQQGSEILHFNTLANTDLSDCRLLGLTDNEKEIQTIARYAKSIWKKDPDATIGCVVPSLDKIRDRVMQIFSEVFAENNTFSIDIKNSPFNISAGKRLSHYPIINTALQLLFLYKKNVSIETLSYLLTSPFLGEGEAERLKRSSFDSLLRKSNTNHINLTNFPSLATHCPHLAKRIKQFLDLIANQSENLSYTAWAEFFNELLTTLGWPGERSLSSEEYQIVESWMKLLVDYTSLDQITQSVNMQQALHTLQKMASKALFQPQTPEAPIQILGILEAAAIPFDYLWIAGMDDVSWPPQPRPNPFIPKSLQRELNMPHATAERELMFCQLLLEQFTQSASHLIFSHAEKHDELELQASPLIKHYPVISLEDLDLDTYLTPAERIHQTKHIETISDDQAPALITTEPVRGGVNVIKQQALCAFKAFSECRLHAQELEQPLPGLRAKDRGNLIHKTLELLWNQLENQAQLLALKKDKLDQLIQECIDHALTTTPHGRNDHTQYLALEKQRLHSLINDWLSLEKQRPPFKVLNSEKTSKLTINHLNLSIRIDRIDELDDGKKLIIDYKTGKNSDINSWFGDRPDEPQLPFYSLLDSDNTVGITFAQVASGETCFKGLSQYSLEIKGIKTLAETKKATSETWSEQLDQWKKTLSQLSDDFYQGKAKVDPKDLEQTCLWCALKPLCRINEETPA